MFGKKKKAPKLAKEQGEELGDLLSRHFSEWSSLIGNRTADLSKDAKKAAKKASKEAGSYTTMAEAKARKYANAGKKWAEPRLDKAKDTISDISGDAQDKWEKDLLPRLQAAIEAAREESESNADLKTKAQNIADRTSKALTTDPRAEKRGKAGRTLGWLLVGAATAGIGYLIWKRNQPVEDPWAEAYWEDIAAEDAAAKQRNVVPGAKKDVEVAEDAPAVPEEVVEQQAKDAVVEPKVDTPKLDEDRAAKEAGLEGEAK